MMKTSCWLFVSFFVLQTAFTHHLYAQTSRSLDTDRDGYPAWFDCNAQDPTIHPGVLATHGDVDENCDYISDLADILIPNNQYPTFTGAMTGSGTALTGSGTAYHGTGTFNCSGMPDFDYSISGEFSRVGRVSNSTTLNFDYPTMPNQLSFVIADLDSDEVQVNALDRDGNAVPDSVIIKWFEASHDADNDDLASDIPNWDRFNVDVSITQLSFMYESISFFPRSGVQYMPFIFGSTCGSENPYLELFPWLQNELSNSDCASLSIVEYDLGPYSFIYLSDGRLFFEDGTFYCQTTENQNCLALYNFNDSDIANMWACDDADDDSENENENENQNGTSGTINLDNYPWTSDVLSAFDCATLVITEYDLGPYAYLIISDGNMSEMYFEDGTFYCENIDSRDCASLYNLDDSQITNSWTCGSGDSDGGESTGESVFTDFSWISSILGPDCSVGYVREYKQGVYSYFLIDNGIQTTLYFQDGAAYCVSSESYDCVAAYGFGAPTRSFTCSGFSLQSAEERSPVADINVKDQISVWPNPSSGEFNVKHSSEQAKIFVFTSAGQLLKTIQTQDSNQTTIDLSGQESGMYFIKVLIGNETFNSRLVKL